MAKERAAQSAPPAEPGGALLKGVLSRAEHPALLGEYLAEEFLALSGAALVVVMRCTPEGETVVGIAGEGGESLTQSRSMARLMRQACSVAVPVILDEGDVPFPGSYALFPMRLAGRAVGSILLLGLPGERRPLSHASLDNVFAVAALAFAYGALQEEEETFRREREGATVAALTATGSPPEEGGAAPKDALGVPGEAALHGDAPCGYQVLDGEGVFREVNDTELSWLGYRREEVVGVKKFSDLLTENGARALRLHLPALKREGSLTGAEFELVKKNGAVFPVLLNAVAQRDTESNLVKIRATLFPTGDLKRAQKELRTRNEELKMSRLALLNLVDDLNRKSSEIVEANVRLRDVDQLKSMFIASMSHELRTPLNSVIGFSSILLNEWVGPLNAEQRENLETVLRSGKHLLALVNDVIDVSKVEAGQVERNLDRFDLYEVIEEVAALLEQEMLDRGLTLKVNNLHQRMITDRRRFLQCLINVLGNSAKYTEEGGVEVTARVVPGVGTFPDAVEIEIEDTGVGIKEEEMGRLFNPFVRMESHLRSTVLGTGLGLYLTRKLMEEVLGGTITAQSVYGKGSRFVLRLPIVPAAGPEGESKSGTGAAPPRESVP